MPTLNLGGGSTPQLQKLPSTRPALKPFAEPPAPLNLRKPLNLSPRPLDLKPAPLATQRYGAGSSPGTTLPTSQGTSNALNRSLQRQRQNFAEGGNRTASAPKGTRGVSQSAANINAFGSTKGNVPGLLATLPLGAPKVMSLVTQGRPQPAVLKPTPLFRHGTTRRTVAQPPRPKELPPSTPPLLNQPVLPEQLQHRQA